MNAPVLLALLAAVGGASAAGTGMVRRYAISHSLLDIPNERSSHAAPTPRGGGIPIAAAWVAAIAALGLLGALPAPVALGLAGGAAAVAVLGWLDDHLSLGAAERLTVHFLAAGWVVGWLGGLPTVDLGVVTLPLGSAGAVLAAVTIVWLVNLYNFMDGVDALAASEAVIVGIATGMLLWLSDAGALAMAAWILAASAAGFLVWNLPPARIFMGDVGSGLLGFAFASVALAAERLTSLPGLVLLIPLMVFICDATFTLVRRLVRRERVYEAHRSHVYQILARRGWSHGQVTLLVTGINLGLAGLALLAWARPVLLPVALMAAVAGVAAAGALALRVRPNGPSRRQVA